MKLLKKNSDITNKFDDFLPWRYIKTCIKTVLPLKCKKKNFDNKKWYKTVLTRIKPTLKYLFTQYQWEIHQLPSPTPTLSLNNFNRLLSQTATPSFPISGRMSMRFGP